jgi:dTDP-glucose pyrophosphorylase
MDKRTLDNACLPPDATATDAVQRLDATGLGIVLVTDRERRLLGTITDGDIRRALLSGPDADSVLSAPLADFLASKNNPVYPRPVSLPAHSSPEQIRAVMMNRKLRHVPLLDHNGRVADLALLDELLDGGGRAEPLQAVVMAGGLGTRLRPLTEDTPKPMLPVGGRPLLERTIDRLKEAGVRDVVVSTRYKAHKVREHFEDGSRFGVNVAYTEEDKPLGTAGSLRLITRPPSTLLVINGDVLTGVDFRAMHDFHIEHGAALTVGVRQFSFNVPYGVVETDGVRVARLREKPTYTSFVNAGVYLLEPEAFDRIPAPSDEGAEPFNMTDLIGRLVDDGRTVASFPIHEYWMDIGQPQDYDRVQQDIAAGLAS